jgi:hypothetical protein
MAGTPAGASVDRRTEAFCFRSAQECNASPGVPCAGDPPCREASATTCANAGPGFAFYCPSVDVQDDPASGATCYKRQSECERTTANDCDPDGPKKCVQGQLCSGIQGAGYLWTCPSRQQQAGQQQAGGAAAPSAGAAGFAGVGQQAQAGQQQAGFAAAPAALIGG